MPFVKTSQSIPSRLHISDAALKVRAGVAALVVLLLCVGGFNIVQMTGGEAFSLDEAAQTDQGAANMGDGAPPPNATSPAINSSASEESNNAIRSTQANANTSNAVSTSDPLHTVFVFVSGAVLNPGVYELPSDARVNDAIEKAGGFTDEAAPDAVNLARLLQDGEHIAIPTQAEVDQGIVHNEESGIAQASPATPETTPSQDSSTTVVNINNADEATLQQLPGVGPATATKIVANREEQGLFATPEDIMRVSGIGQKKFESMREFISV